MKYCKSPKKVFCLIAIVFLFILLVASASFYLRNYTPFLDFLEDKESFSVNPFLVKLILSPGEETSSVMRIQNNEDFSQEFFVSVEGVEDLVFLGDTNFSLEPNQIRELIIHVEDPFDVSDFYLGNIFVKSNLLQKRVPILINVEKSLKGFAITQGDIPQYRDPSPGDKLGVEVKIFNLLDKNQKSVHMNYLVMDFSGNVYVSEDETLSISDSIGVSKVFNLPSSLSIGNYVLITSLEYDGEKTFSSYFFELKQKEEKIVFGNFEYSLIIIFVFALVVSFIFARAFHKKDIYLKRLNDLQKAELEKNLSIINSYKKELESVQNLAKRKERLKNLSKEKEKTLDEIKKKQKKQLSEFKKLSKEKKEDEMKKRLNQWLSEGYHFNELKNSVKSVPKNKIKGQLDSFRKQGYKMDFLNKK